MKPSKKIKELREEIKEIIEARHSVRGSSFELSVGEATEALVTLFNKYFKRKGVR